MRTSAVKVCVIADTHVREIIDLPTSLLEDLKSADLIVHLGDFVSRQVVDDLAGLGDFRGVAGNHDGRQIRVVLPRKDVIEVNGKRLGLIHGHGCRGLIGMETGLAAHFGEEKLDAILYGHTHVAENQAVDGTLFFNPGSVMGRFPAREASYGVLTVGESIAGQIRYFNLPGDGKTGSLLGNLARYTARLRCPKWCPSGLSRMFGTPPDPDR